MMQYFQIESHQICRSDYLEIWDIGRLLGRLCGNELPEPIRTSSNIVRVVFSSDATNQKGGFLAAFEKGMLFFL